MMRLFISIIIVAIVIFGGGYLIFELGRNNKLRQCSGIKIGQEKSGQMREIYKCEDGTIQIF